MKTVEFEGLSAGLYAEWKRSTCILTVEKDIRKCHRPHDIVVSNTSAFIPAQPVAVEGKASHFGIPVSAIICDDKIEIASDSQNMVKKKAIVHATLKASNVLMAS